MEGCIFEEMRALHKNETWEVVCLVEKTQWDANGFSQSNIKPMALLRATR